MQIENSTKITKCQPSGQQPESLSNCFILIVFYSGILVAFKQKNLNAHTIYCVLSVTLFFGIFFSPSSMSSSEHKISYNKTISPSVQHTHYYNYIN